MAAKINRPYYWPSLTLITRDDDPNLTREDVLPFVNKILSAIAGDDRDKLAELVKRGKTAVRSLEESGYAIAPSVFLKWAICHRAIKCAEFLLSEAKIARSYASLLSNELFSPTHLAATEFLPEFVRLCIEHLGPVDMPCYDLRSEYCMMPPLDAAVEALSKKISWTPSRSIYELIFTLCDRSMELKQAILTISLIMGASESQQVASGVIQTRKSIYHYGREGKILQLGIILFVDAVSELGIFKKLSNGEHLTLCKSAAASILSRSGEELNFEFDGNGDILDVGEKGSKEKLNSVVNSERYILDIDRKRVMMSVLLLLKIFHRTNFNGLNLITRETFAKRVTDAGFDGFDDDLQSWSWGNLNATRVFDCGENMAGKPPSPSPPPPPGGIGSSSNNMPMPMRGLHFGRLMSSSAGYSHGKRGISSCSTAAQMDTRAAAGVVKAVHRHHHHEGLLVQRAGLRRKMWDVFALTLKKRMIYA